MGHDRIESLRDESFEVSVQGLTKRFDGRTLWQNLSFAAKSGAITAITGPSGSGKTTLLNCIGLLEDYDAGSVALGEWKFHSHDIKKAEKTQQKCFRDVLGFLFQNYGLIENWDVERNLMVPLKVGARATKDCRKAQIDRALRRVGMEGARKAKVFTLSGGEQQRVALARLILKRPAVILADEPTSALDTDNAQMVFDVLREQADQGAAVLISSHSDDIVARCDACVSIR
jgi:putative ABC transport system ATP-binding protein